MMMEPQSTTLHMSAIGRVIIRVIAEGDRARLFVEKLFRKSN